MRMFYKLIVFLFMVGLVLPGYAQSENKKFSLADFCLNYTFMPHGGSGTSFTERRRTLYGFGIQRTKISHV